MKPIALLLAASFAVPPMASAASLEKTSYDSRRMVEPVIPAEDLERHLVAQETRKYEVEVREGRPWPVLEKKQKQQFLGFMAAGGIIGALVAGGFGALVGLAAGGMIWYLLAWSEVL